MKQEKYIGNVTCKNATNSDFEYINESYSINISGVSTSLNRRDFRYLSEKKENFIYYPVFSKPEIPKIQVEGDRSTVFLDIYGSFDINSSTTQTVNIISTQPFDLYFDNILLEAGEHSLGNVYYALSELWITEDGFKRKISLNCTRRNEELRSIDLGTLYIRSYIPAHKVVKVMFSDSGFNALQNVYGIGSFTISDSGEAGTGYLIRPADGYPEILVASGSVNEDIWAYYLDFNFAYSPLIPADYRYYYTQEEIDEVFGTDEKAILIKQRGQYDVYLEDYSSEDIEFAGETRVFRYHIDSNIGSFIPVISNEVECTVINNILADQTISMVVKNRRPENYRPYLLSEYSSYSNLKNYLSPVGFNAFLNSAVQNQLLSSLIETPGTVAETFSNSFGDSLYYLDSYEAGLGKRLRVVNKNGSSYSILVNVTNTNQATEDNIENTITELLETRRQYRVALGLENSDIIPCYISTWNNYKRLLTAGEFLLKAEPLYRIDSTTHGPTTKYPVEWRGLGFTGVGSLALYDDKVWKLLVSSSLDSEPPSVETGWEVVSTGCDVVYSLPAEIAIKNHLYKLGDDYYYCIPETINDNTYTYIQVQDGLTTLTRNSAELITHTLGLTEYNRSSAFVEANDFAPLGSLVKVGQNLIDTTRGMGINVLHFSAIDLWNRNLTYNTGNLVIYEGETSWAVWSSNEDENLGNEPSEESTSWVKQRDLGYSIDDYLLPLYYRYYKIDKLPGGVSIHHVTETEYNNGYFNPTQTPLFEYCEYSGQIYRRGFDLLGAGQNIINVDNSLGSSEDLSSYTELNPDSDGKYRLPSDPEPDQRKKKISNGDYTTYYKHDTTSNTWTCFHFLVSRVGAEKLVVNGVYCSGYNFLRSSGSTIYSTFNGSDLYIEVITETGSSQYFIYKTEEIPELLAPNNFPNSSSILMRSGISGQLILKGDQAGNGFGIGDMVDNWYFYDFSDYTSRLVLSGDQVRLRQKRITKAIVHNFGDEENEEPKVYIGPNPAIEILVPEDGDTFRFMIGLFSINSRLNYGDSGSQITPSYNNVPGFFSFTHGANPTIGTNNFQINFLPNQTNSPRTASFTFTNIEDGYESSVIVKFVQPVYHGKVNIDTRKLYFNAQGDIKTNTLSFRLSTDILNFGESNIKCEGVEIESTRITPQGQQQADGVMSYDVRMKLKPNKFNYFLDGFRIKIGRQEGEKFTDLTVGDISGIYQKRNGNWVALNNYTLRYTETYVDSYPNPDDYNDGDIICVCESLRGYQEYTSFQLGLLRSTSNFDDPFEMNTIRVQNFNELSNVFYGNFRRDNINNINTADNIIGLIQRGEGETYTYTWASSCVSDYIIGTDQNTVYRITDLLDVPIKLSKGVYGVNGKIVSEVDLRNSNITDFRPTITTPEFIDLKFATNNNNVDQRVIRIRNLGNSDSMIRVVMILRYEDIDFNFRFYIQNGAISE